ncbi:MAG: hypothetical protein KF884_07055 [Fimbriimonadaceae bacterium]|nr:hypothetical protein [Fimbriimonadaceae bacterium]QYK57307.1 MAG: hypothetical protein KF884_07055 [Fimbriimonadaceae bacterium]
MKRRDIAGMTFILAMSQAQGAEPTLRWIGSLGPSFPVAAPAAVSDDGKTVVGQATGSGGVSRPFRWRDSTGFQDLGSFGGLSGAATGVSANGLVVVGWSTDPQPRSKGFRWIAATGLVDLGALSGQPTEALAVNGAGNEVFGQSEQAFRWRAGQLAALSTLGGPASAALGCTRDGNWVAGWSMTPSMLQVACVWNDVAIIPIYSPWARRAEARAVADGGLAVVGTALDSIGQSHAFSWSLADGMRFLPTWGLSATALGVSQDGNTTVGLYFAGSVRRAFLHKPSTGTADLTSLAGRALFGTGSRLESAVAVSRDGRFVVGQGWNEAVQRLDGYILDLEGKLFRGESGRAVH